MQAARTCETAQIIPDGLVVVVLGRQNHITLELTLNGVAAVMEMLLAVEGVRGAAMNLTFAFVELVDAVLQHYWGNSVQFYFKN